MGGCIPFHESDVPGGDDEDFGASGKRQKNRQLFAFKLKKIEAHINKVPLTDRCMEERLNS